MADYFSGERPGVRPGDDDLNPVDEDQSPASPSCAACGDRIGVYERVHREDPDGTLTPTSLLADGSDGRVARRYFHIDCAATAES